MLSNDNPPHPTRVRSLRAALDVVREEGISELTTRAIARRSGLTQPAIYRHFTGKDELVSAVLGEIRQEVFTRLENAAAAEDIRERLFSSLRVFRDYAIEEPRLYDALFLQTAEGIPLPPPIDPARGGNIFGTLAARVTESAEAGILRSSGPVATALTLAAHSQGLALLYRQGRFGSAERFTDFFDRSMADLITALGK